MIQIAARAIYPYSEHKTVKYLRENSAHGQQDTRYLSTSCYSLLLNFADCVNGPSHMQDPL